MKNGGKSKSVAFIILVSVVEGPHSVQGHVTEAPREAHDMCTSFCI